MPIYKAPLRDQQFVMHEVLDAVGQLKQLPRYAELDVDTLNQVVEEAGKFCEELLLPINQSGDAEGCTYDATTHSVKTPHGFKLVSMTLPRTSFTSCWRACQMRRRAPKAFRCS